MINFFKIIISFILVSFFSNCSQILQTVELKINAEDSSTQEAFNVVEKTLTIREAREQNNSPYKRAVLQPGKGDSARTIPENQALQSSFPNTNRPTNYKIGIGDTLTFSRLIENNRSRLENSGQWPEDLGNLDYTLGVGDNLALTLLREENVLTEMPSGDANEKQNLIVETQKDVILETAGRIGSDGSVLLLEVGRLEAKGKTLNELQSEVRNILIRNGASPRFQLEIVEFKSQKAYLTINQTSKVIILDDKQTTLRDILTSAAVGFKPGIITYVRLQRNGNEYLMPLRKVFGPESLQINIYSGDHIFVEDSSTKIASSISTVGHDGNVVFAGVGRIKAVGRSLDSLRTEIYSLVEKIPGSENAFQIEVTKFSSQTALVNIPGQVGGVIQISNSAIALDQVLTENGLSVDGNAIIRITLQRHRNNYIFTLDELLNPLTDRIYLQPNDRVKIETLPYKENKIFILGAVSPQIFKINPSNRETLADVLFTNGGPLSSASAKRSEVYLLRGKSPVVAYHLDAQSPTRLIVADAMELRPNDILFVAEQPITSFNRTLATIVPLRILLRDIQDENIP